MMIVATAAGALALAAAPAQAQEKPQVPALVKSVVDCRAETNEAARLRCYDEAAGNLARATESGSLVILDREAVRKTRRSLFGFDIPNLPFFRSRNGEEEAPKEIVAKLTSVRDSGLYLTLTLDNGAVWQTTEPTPPARPKAGDQIRILRGATGAYMVQMGYRRLRARRVR
jgi:hypothetical protein